MANFKSEEIHRGLIVKFQGKLYKVLDFPTKVTVFAKNLKKDDPPVEITAPRDRLKRPSEEELKQHFDGQN